MPPSIYLGIDVGTQGIRGIAWQQGRILARAQAPLATVTPQNGWAVQQITEIWQAFQRVVRELTEVVRDNGRIRGIGMDATASLLLARPSGEPQSEVLLWMDVRADQYTEEISRLTGRLESAELPWPKALWLYHHARSVWESSVLVEVADWLTWRLTGQWTRSESSAILKWHGGAPDYLPNWAGAYADIVGALPQRVVKVGQSAGEVLPHVARELNLPCDSEPILVAGSIIDAYAGAIGSGALQPGTMALIMGSSTCELFHDKSFTATAGLWGPFDDIYHEGLAVLEAGQPSTGSVVRWVETQMGQGKSLELLDSMAAGVPVGALGLKVFPAWQGVRSPWPRASHRGMIHGLSLTHNVSHVLRAVYEGTAVDIRRVMDVVASRIERIVVSGGGIQSALWTQIIADICGVPLEIADRDAVTRGAALLAAKAGGAMPTLTVLPHSGRRDVVSPSPNVRGYQELYGEYLYEFPTITSSLVSKASTP